MRNHLLRIWVGILFFTSMFSAAVVTATNIGGSSIERGMEGNGWNQTFGGSSYDEGYSVQQTTDGGYIIAGATFSFGAGDWDVWLIKTNASGNEVWNKTFGGSWYDRGSSVQQTTDGGYIIAGSTYSYSQGEFDVWLIKTNASGNEVWNKTFGGTNVDWGCAVQQTTDGGYIIAGYTESYGAGGSDVWLIKTDFSGYEVWNKTFGGSQHDRGFSVGQTTDGGYVVAGYTVSFDDDATGCDVWLIKTDATGVKEWDKTYGGTGIPNKTDIGYSVNQTSDGGYIVAGETEIYFVSSADVWLLKTDADGNEEWIKTFGGADSDRGRSVQQTTDGGYIIAGWASSYGPGDSDIWLIKTNASGDEVWNYLYGFEEDSLDWGYSVQQVSDEGYIIVGATMPDGWRCAGANELPSEEGTDVWLIKTTISENRPPDIPGEPQGPSTGLLGEVYDFVANTTDPDDDPIAYQFDWGDGTFSNWTEFVPSGTTVTVSYSWDDAGSYEVRVKAKDIHGAMSPSWSPPHTIIIGEHSLQVKSIRGGIGITGVIKNDGEATIFHIDWHILVEGGVLGLIDVDTYGTKTELDVAEEVPVKTGSLGLFHFGGIKITVTVVADHVDMVTKETTGFVVGPFVLVR